MTKLSVQGLTSERIRAFYYVGVTKSMTMAGDMMGICQSAVTKHVQALQDMLGVPLCTREDRKIKLTADGEEVFEFVKRHLFEVDGFRKSLKERTEGLSGELRIGTFPSFGTMLSSRYLTGFYEKYPNIRLKIHTPHFDPSSLDADIIIGFYVADHPDIVQLPLFKVVVGFYAHQAYLDQYGMPADLEDLKNHRLLAANVQHEHRSSHVNWILKVGIPKASQQRTPWLSMDNSQVLLEALNNGLGIGGLNTLYKPLLSNSKIIRLFPHLQSEVTTVYFSYNEKTLNPQKYTVLYNHLMQYMGVDFQQS